MTLFRRLSLLLGDSPNISPADFFCIFPGNDVYSPHLHKMRWGLFGQWYRVTGTGCHGKKSAHIGVCCQLIYLIRSTKYYLKHFQYYFGACVWIQLELDEVVCKKLEESGKQITLEAHSGQMDLTTADLVLFDSPWTKQYLGLLGKIEWVFAHLHGGYRVHLYLVWRLYDSVHGLQMNVSPFKCVCSSLVGMGCDHIAALQNLKSPSPSWSSLGPYLTAGTAMTALVTLSKTARWISTMRSYLGTWVPFLYIAITVGNGRYACILMSFKNLLHPRTQPASDVLPNAGECVNKHDSSSNREIEELTKFLQEFPKANSQVGIRLVVD